MNSFASIYFHYTQLTEFSNHPFRTALSASARSFPEFLWQRVLLFILLDEQRSREVQEAVADPVGWKKRNKNQYLSQGY
jgi:hypothetical protein